MFDFWSNFWPGWVRAEVFVFCSLRRNTFKINCLWVRSEILMCLISGPDQIGLWGFFLGPLIGALTAASQRSAKKCPVINVLWFFSFFFFDANVVVLSHRGRSEVEREMAPESYGLLMPGLSDSWLAGLWAREASIWASDTWNDKEKKTGNETLVEELSWPPAENDTTGVAVFETILPLQISWLCTAPRPSGSSAGWCHRGLSPDEMYNKQELKTDINVRRQNSSKHICSKNSYQSNRGESSDQVDQCWDGVEFPSLKRQKEGFCEHYINI